MEKPLFCYFGHHKCASKYIDGMILDSVCKKAKLNKGSFHSPKQFDNNPQYYIDKLELDFFVYRNADFRTTLKIKREFLGFHVIRDPRDILVSAYFSHRNSHSTSEWPELNQLRKILLAKNLADGLFEELAFIKNLPTDGVNLRPLVNMEHWDYHDNRILEIKFEDMIDKPYKTFLKIFKHLNIISPRYPSLLKQKGHESGGISRKDLRDIIDEYSFKKITGGRENGDINKKSHYRKGQPGDWKNYFDDALKKEFKKEFPGLVTKLGYEKDENW